MSHYRSKFENFYSDKGGSYSTIGSIVPVLVNDFTNPSGSGTVFNSNYAHEGFLYCDGSEHNIKDYPLLYEIIGNDYLISSDIPNSVVFDSAGGESSIFRTFVDNNDLYAEVYKTNFISDNNNIIQQRALPNGTSLTFVSSLGSYPAGSIFTADTQYTLEYNESYQNLAQRVDTDVYRFIVLNATETVNVSWSLNIPALILNASGSYIIPTKHYGTIPLLSPQPNQFGDFDLTGYDVYEGAENASIQIFWSNLSGLPEGVSVSSYEVYLQNLSLDNYVLWNVTNIPSNVTFLNSNEEIPEGSIIQNNTVSSLILPNPDGTTPWIRSNGYSGPQPTKGNVNIYRINVIANLSNGQTLTIHRDFLAGNGIEIPPFGPETYPDNFSIVGSSSGVTNTSFNVLMSSLGTHPTIRFRKSYLSSDYPFLLGKFRVPDYRERKLIGFGDGVNGPGTPLVEDRVNISVGDIGGRWFISTDAIKNPNEFFSISDVVTTGYSDVQTQIQPYLVGEKQYVVGPIEDYVFARPPEHQHQLLHSVVNESNLVSLGGVDTFAVQYQNNRGSIIDFVPGGQNSSGLALGHSHGLLGSRPLNSFSATYGNTEGIGESFPDPENSNCNLYGITEAPPLNTVSVVSDGTFITVTTSTDHNLSDGDFVTITNAGTLNGNFEIIPTGLTATNFQLQPDPPRAAATETNAVVKLASGVFDEIFVTPDPDVWVVNNTTVIGGKETIAFDASLYSLSYQDVLDSSGNLTKTAGDAGVNVLRYQFDIYAPGGGGGGTISNGGNGGNANVTFTLDGTNYTITAFGGQGGGSGNNGGAAGQGGGFSIPTALLSDPRVTVSFSSNGPNGTAGGNSDGSSPSGGLANGGDGTAGNGGSGGGNTTIINSSFSRQFTSNGSYNPSNDTNFPNNSVINDVRIDISGGAGGNGNPNATNGCTQSPAGGPGYRGTRILGTVSPTTFSFEIGTKGGDGFNNVTTNDVEARNTAVGTGSASGGNGGRGAWANGGSGGAGGGATGVITSSGYIMGAGGGGGGGGSGGNSATGDGCSRGNPALGPASAVRQSASIGPFSGLAGGEGGCTAGGGGGGGGGFDIPGSGGGGGDPEGATGGPSGIAHPTDGTTGGGGGGTTGGSATRAGVVTNVVESLGSTGNGYVRFTSNYTQTIVNPSGGGGGAGGILTVVINGESDDIGSFGTTVVASMQGPGAAGSGGGTAGSQGYIRLQAFEIEPGASEVVGVSEPAGRVYDTPGFPTTVPSGTGSTVGGDIWHSSSQDVNVVTPTIGSFPSGGTLTGNLSDRFIEFSGSGNRFLQLGPLNLTSAEQLVFTVIKGNGTNGGDSPEEPLELYYKTSLDSPTESLIQVVVPTTVTASGYANYIVNLDESNPARISGAYLVLRQTRPATSGDNQNPNADELDKWGIAQFGIVYGEISETVFTAATNATIKGNLGSCGPNSGIDVVRRTVSAGASNIRFTDGTFTLSTSTPISVFAEARVLEPISLTTRYHRSKYLIKSF